MTHRDRAGDPSGQRAGRREAAGDAGHRQGFPTPSGGSPARPEAVSQGFRTASRMASDVPHRRATRSWPKTLGNRLYGSFSALFGITELSRPRAVSRCYRPGTAIRATGRTPCRADGRVPPGAERTAASACDRIGPSYNPACDSRALGRQASQTPVSPARVLWLVRRAWVNCSRSTPPAGRFGETT